MIDATFIISNRSALFEEAAAENSGTTDSDVSDLGQSIPFYPVYFPYPASAGSPIRFFGIRSPVGGG
jgi:hypothetical protein